MVWYGLARSFSLFFSLLLPPWCATLITRLYLIAGSWNRLLRNQRSSFRGNLHPLHPTPVTLQLNDSFKSLDSLVQYAVDNIVPNVYEVTPAQVPAHLPSCATKPPCTTIPRRSLGANAFHGSPRCETPGAVTHVTRPWACLPQPANHACR